MPRTVREHTARLEVQAGWLWPHVATLLGQRQEERLRGDLHGHMWEAQLTRAGLSFQRNGAGVRCGQSQPRAI